LVKAKKGKKTKIISEIFDQHFTTQNLIFLGHQVLKEFSNLMIGKFKKTPFEVLNILTRFGIYDSPSSYPIFLANHQTFSPILRALKIMENKKFSLWDSLVIAEALNENCSVLVSEDIQHGQNIGELKIVNPFKI
jgi:predicted nucleic acid-binding protein